ncbi:MAG: hypothetical protein NVSMB57_12860 [Actinomycetota bacterium]
MVLLIAVYTLNVGTLWPGNTHRVASRPTARVVNPPATSTSDTRSGERTLSVSVRNATNRPLRLFVRGAGGGESTVGFVLAGKATKVAVTADSGECSTAALIARDGVVDVAEDSGPQCPGATWTIRPGA